MDDLRLAFRTLRRAPAYTLTVILTLALGIGGATAVYSVLHSVILRPLPYAPADRVMLLAERDSPPIFASRRIPPFRTGPPVPTRSRRWRSARAQHRDEDRRGGAAAGRHIRIGRVLPGAPRAGRRRPRARAGRLRAWGAARRRALVALWQRGFGGDRAALGRSVTLGDRAYTIVGVMPAGFAYPTWADFYAPIAAIRSTDAALGQRGLHVDSRVVGRLRAGVDSAAGQRALSAVAAHLAEVVPGGERRLARRGTAPGRVRSPG